MDVLGSVRLVSDGAGMMLTEGFGGGRQDYTAFGEPFVIMSDGSYQPNWYSLPTRYGYAGASGYERLASLGGGSTQALHLGERFYNPGLGRFLQQDPIGGGLNVYAYVWNSPLRNVDPLGLTASPIDEPPGYDIGPIIPMPAKPETAPGTGGVELYLRRLELIPAAMVTYPCAVLADGVAIVFGVPWYPRSTFQAGDATRSVHDGFRKSWRGR